MFTNVNVISNVKDFNVEDTSSSPFSVYPNETIVAEQRHSFCVRPTEVDDAILHIINRTLFCTCALIMVQFREMSIEADVANVKHRLQRLCESEFLQAYRFRLPNGGKSSNLVYRIAWRGAGYLKAQGTSVRMTTYLANISEDPTAVKKILSAAQFVIRTGVSLDSTQFCQPIFVPCNDPSRKSEKIFRPQTVTQADDRTIFVEAVRQNKNWETELLDKLARMEKVCNAKQTNIPILNPALVLVAESTTHMQMLLRMMERKPISLPIYITADPLIYATPKSCLYTLKSKGFWASLFAS